MDKIKIENFIDEFLKIINSKPRYVSGGDGSNGTADCIGAIIGAIRKCGGSWTGIHGSNYSARFEMQNLYPIKSTEQLSAGDIVYKGRLAGEKAYDLKQRYQKGGSMDKGDYTDYYHVGVVLSISPLQIGHMTSPTALIDTKIGKWGYVGRLKKLDYTNNAQIVENSPINKALNNVGSNSSDGLLKLRKTPNNKVILDWIPINAEFIILERVNNDWLKVNYKNKIGYVMSKFIGFKGENIPLNENNISVDEKIKQLEERIKKLENML